MRRRNNWDRVAENPGEWNHWNRSTWCCIAEKTARALLFSSRRPSRRSHRPSSANPLFCLYPFASPTILFHLLHNLIYWLAAKNYDGNPLRTSVRDQRTSGIYNWIICFRGSVIPKLVLCHFIGQKKIKLNCTIGNFF